MTRNSVAVNLSVIRANYSHVCKKVGDGCRVAAVVKANAYGHGAVRVAKALSEEGCTFFAVASLSEAIELRSNGITEEILILGVTMLDDCAELVKYNLIQNVSSLEYAKELARRFPGTRVHVKIDTGMSRLGFYCHNESDLKNALLGLKQLYALGLSFEGIFTHFAEADEPESDFTQKQYSIFTALISMLKKEGINPGICHCSNSGAIFNFPQMSLDMVRAGIVLYGLAPSPRTDIPGLVPAMEFCAAVMQVHKLYKGDTVSYGRRFEAERDMTVAAVAVGYADGYTRLLSQKDCFLIDGHRAKILGNICMDITLVDVTGLCVAPGDSAVIFGKSAGLYKSVDELAELTGTINYEYLCDIGRRAERIYID